MSGGVRAWCGACTLDYNEHGDPVCDCRAAADDVLASGNLRVIDAFETCVRFKVPAHIAADFVLGRRLPS